LLKRKKRSPESGSVSLGSLSLPRTKKKKTRKKHRYSNPNKKEGQFPLSDVGKKRGVLRPTKR